MCRVSRYISKSFLGIQFIGQYFLNESPLRALNWRQALVDIAAATQSYAVVYYFNREPMPNCPQWSKAFVVINPKAVRDR
jgi:hypothetical protein